MLHNISKYQSHTAKHTTLWPLMKCIHNQNFYTHTSVTTNNCRILYYIVLVSYPSQVCAVTMLVFWMPMNYDRWTGLPTACCSYKFSNQKSYYGQTHKKDYVHSNAFLYKRSGL